MKVLFYPDKVMEFSKMHKIIDMCGIETTNDPQDTYDVAVFWSHHKKILHPDAHLADIMANKHVINIGGLDVTKTKVERIMMEVMGYNAIVPPEYNMQMPIIQKNDRQANHCISIIYNDSNYVKSKDVVCLRLLSDNVGDNYRTYRCFISGDHIVSSWENIYSDKSRFGKPISRDRVKTSSWLSKEERALIVKYCAVYGTEFTELDIIRDAHDNRIYIVDNNNIPGRTNVWPGDEIYSNEVYEELADNFMELLNKWA